MSSPVNDGSSQEVPESMSGTLDDDLAQDPTADESELVDSELVNAEASPAGEASGGAGVEAGLRQQVNELTADLKRVSAEFANYRKRVERDREGVIAAAKASVAGDLLTVLDDLERAEAHGDLTGAFKAVADKLLASLQSSGLQGFGAEGDEFDPSVHEAVQHATSPDVDGPTVTTVLRRGYSFGERVLRPAMVVVTEHEPAENGTASTVEASAVDDASGSSSAGEFPENSLGGQGANGADPSFADIRPQPGDNRSGEQQQ